MSKWDKLLKRIYTLSKDLRFNELRKVLEDYGYTMHSPKSGSSHYTFRKPDCPPITIPKHEPIKKFMLNWSSRLQKTQKVKVMRVKTLNEYLKLPYKMEIIPDTEEGGFTVSFPELPGCITCGNTLSAALDNAADAKSAWIETAMKDGLSIPEPDALNDYSGQFKLRIPKSLHKQLSEHSKMEGISMNQYCLYLLSRNDALLNKISL